MTATHDIQFRMGSGFKDHITKRAQSQGSDRSAWSQCVFASTLKDGLPNLIDTGLLLEALVRDTRCLLRVDASIARRVEQASRDAGISTAMYCMLALIGASQEG